MSRTRTLDLLASLPNSDLLFTPGAGQSPLWQHFRHLGRVQENYTEALTTRKVQFSPRKASYVGGPEQGSDYQA